MCSTHQTVQHKYKRTGVFSNAKINSSVFLLYRDNFRRNFFFFSIMKSKYKIQSYVHICECYTVRDIQKKIFEKNILNAAIMSVSSHLNKFKFGNGLLFSTTILFNDDSELKFKKIKMIIIHFIYLYLYLYI